MEKTSHRLFLFKLITIQIIIFDVVNRLNFGLKLNLIWKGHCTNLFFFFYDLYTLVWNKILIDKVSLKSLILSQSI